MVAAARRLHVAQSRIVSTEKRRRLETRQLFCLVNITGMAVLEETEE